MAARAALIERCAHRVREEVPLAYGRGGEPFWPDLPTCVICAHEFEEDRYCPDSHDHCCYYEGPTEPVRGSEGWGGSEATPAAACCVYCDAPYVRER